MNLTIEHKGLEFRIIYEEEEQWEIIEIFYDNTRIMGEFRRFLVQYFHEDFELDNKVELRFRAFKEEYL